LGACMKTSLSCSLAGLALLLGSAHAGGLDGTGIPSNMSFYGGGSAGLAAQKGACGAVPSSTDCTDSGTGYKVFAGTRIEPQTTGETTLPSLGAEVGYIDFGNSSANSTILSARGVPIGQSNANSKVTSVYAAGVGYLPVAPRTELIGKAGAAYWSQKGNVDVAVDPTLNSSASSSGVGLLLGGGAQYKLNDNFSVRGEYEHVFGTGNGTSYKSDASLLSVGAVFSTL